MPLSNKVRHALEQNIEMFDAAYNVLISTDEYVDFAAVETSLKDSINALLAKGTDAAELRLLFDVDTQSMAYFNRLVTVYNATQGKTGKSGGGGGSKKQKTAKKTAKKAAKKAAKKKPSATIQEQATIATLAAVESNLNTNFAESKIDGKRKTASVVDIKEIERIVVKSIRAIMNAPNVVSEAIAKAKPSKAKAKAKAKPSKAKAKPSKAKAKAKRNGNGKAPKVQSQNRIAKAMAKN